MKTTTGPADAPDKTERPTKPRKMSSEDKKVQNAIEVDDATWGRITSQAAMQQSAPADVVRRAVEMAYGADNPVGAINSGRDSDPNLAK